MRQLSIIVAVAIIISTGVVHGVWTDRWKASAEVGDAAARLDRVAMTIGDWDGKPLEVDRRQLEIGEVVGHLYRRYENRRTHEVVSVLVVCGRPGPISVHTPDVCYAGAGYEVVREDRHSFQPAPPARPAMFNELDLRKVQSAVNEHLRIFYAWSPGGGWSTPENPRLAFARIPALYKLYLVRETQSPDEPIKDDRALDLARDLLPELDRAIMPGA